MVHITLNAHLLSAQAGYRSAGIHGYIYNTLKHLPPLAPDWHFTALVGAGQPAPHPNLSVERARLATDSPLRRILWEQIGQPSALRRLQPDLHHGLAFVLPPFLRVPGVVTVYDLTFIRYPQALSRTRRAYLDRFTRESCRRAARVIAISESTAEDLVRFLGVPRGKIHLALPGVAEDFQPLPADDISAFREAHNLPDNFFLFLGTLEPRKNLPVLIRAYAGLPADVRREVKLVLAGGKGWDYADIFATIAAYDLEADVVLPGYVECHTLPLWYNAALTFVYPSLFEGWGLPVVEAMACGCPTLVSDVSSLPEAAGDTGLRLPPDDVTAWTQALLKAASDPNWRQASRQAGITRARQFRWEATAAATLAAYGAILEG